MNKYVIRLQVMGVRTRYYFPTLREAREAAKLWGIPCSRIKRNAA